MPKKSDKSGEEKKGMMSMKLVQQQQQHTDQLACVCWMQINNLNLRSLFVGCSEIFLINWCIFNDYVFTHSYWSFSLSLTLFLSRINRHTVQYLIMFSPHIQNGTVMHVCVRACVYKQFSTLPFSHVWINEWI